MQKCRFHTPTYLTILSLHFTGLQLTISNIVHRILLYYIIMIYDILIVTVQISITLVFIFSF